MPWMSVDDQQCPGCMSTLIDVLDVWRRSLMSWMSVDALWCPGCLSMLSDVLDLYRWSTMSWTYVDADWCSRCMATLSDVLDVCWCSLMSWMYIDDHRCPGCILTSWFIAQNFYSRCTPMSFDSYLLICFEKKSQFLLQDTPYLSINSEKYNFKLYTSYFEKVYFSVNAKIQTANFRS